MKARAAAEMLTMAAVLFLALGVTDGLVLDKCKLGKELNMTLPANLTDKISDLVAKLVYHVELSSHFNTSAVTYVTAPHVPKTRVEHGRRKDRSLEFNSEESIEEPHLTFPTINPSSPPAKDDSRYGGGKGRKSRSVDSDSVEEFNATEPRLPFPTMKPSVPPPRYDPVSKGRKSRSVDSDSVEDLHVTEPRLPFPTMNPSSPPPKDNTSGKGRKSRSVNSDSVEDLHVTEPRLPFPTMNPSAPPTKDNTSGKGRKSRSVNSDSVEDLHVTEPRLPFPTMNPSFPPPKDNTSGKGRKSRSAKSSSEESDEKNTVTLYGLFQIPEDLACTSGSELSLNLCSMACTLLIDDDINDDIICVETILYKMLAAANSRAQRASKDLSELYAAFLEKYKNVKNAEYFSSC